jgi:dihydrofolate reductase
MLNVSLIYATSTNRVIGKNGKLPWYLPADLIRFKELTEGAVVIMGRHTYESIPGTRRPLVNRTNVVLSKDKSIVLDGADTSCSLEEAIHKYRKEHIFIIGGTSVLQEGLQYAQTIYLTTVNTRITGGTAFSPVIPFFEWTELSDYTEILREGLLEYKFSKLIKM